MDITYGVCFSLCGFLIFATQLLPLELVAFQAKVVGGFCWDLTVIDKY